MNMMDTIEIRITRHPHWKDGKYELITKDKEIIQGHYFDNINDAIDKAIELLKGRIEGVWISATIGIPEDRR